MGSVEDAQVEVIRLERELVALEAQRDKLSGTLRERDAEVVQLRGKVSEFGKWRASRTEEDSHDGASLREALSELARLRQEKEGGERREKGLQKQVDSLTKELEESALHHRGQLERLPVLMKQVQDLEATVAVKNKEVGTLRDSVHKRAAELDAVQAQYDALQPVLAEKSATIVRLEARVEELIPLGPQLEATIAARESKIAALEKTIELNDQRAKASAERKAKNAAAREADLLATINGKQADIAGLEADMEAVAEERRQWKGRYEWFVADRRDADQEIEDLQNHIKSLNDTIASLHTDKDTLSSDVVAADGRLDTFKGHVLPRLEKRTDQAREEAERIKSGYVEALEHAETLEKQLAEREAEAAKYYKEIVRQNNILDGAEGKFLRLDEEIARLKAQFETANRDKVAAEDRMEDARGRLAGARNRASKAEKAAAVAEAMTKKALEDMESAQIARRQLQQTVGELRAQLTAEMTAASKRIAALEAELLEAKEELETTRIRAESANQETLAANQAKREATMRLNAAETARHAAEVDMEKTRKSADLLSVRLQDATNKLTITKDDLRQAQETLRDTKTEMRAQISILKSDVASHVKAREAASLHHAKQLAAAEERRQVDLDAAADDKANTIIMWQTRVRDVRDTMESQQRMHDNLVLALQASAAATVGNQADEIAVLRNAKTELEVQVAQLGDRLQASQEATAEANATIATLRGELVAERASVKRLKARVKELEQAVAKGTGERVMLEGKVGNLEHRIEVLKGNLSASKSKSAALMVKLAEVKEAREDAMATIISLRSEIQIGNRTIENLREHVDVAVRDKLDAELEAERAAHEVELVTQDRRVLRQSLDATAEQYDAVLNEAQARELKALSQSTALKDDLRIAKSETVLESMVGNRRVLEKDLEVQKMEKERKQWAQRERRLAQLLDAARKERWAMGTKLHQVQDERFSLQTKVSQLNLEMRRLRLDAQRKANGPAAVAADLKVVEDIIEGNTHPQAMASLVALTKRLTERVKELETDLAEAEVEVAEARVATADGTLAGVDDVKAQMANRLRTVEREAATLNAMLAGDATMPPEVAVKAAAPPSPMRRHTTAGAQASNLSSPHSVRPHFLDADSRIEPLPSREDSMFMSGLEMDKENLSVSLVLPSMAAHTTPGTVREASYFDGDVRRRAGEEPSVVQEESGLLPEVRAPSVPPSDDEGHAGARAPRRSAAPKPSPKAVEASTSKKGRPKSSAPTKRRRKASKRSSSRGPPPQHHQSTTSTLATASGEASSTLFHARHRSSRKAMSPSATAPAKMGGRFTIKSPTRGRSRHKA